MKIHIEDALHRCSLITVAKAEGLHYVILNDKEFMIDFATMEACYQFSMDVGTLMMVPTSVKTSMKNSADITLKKIKLQRFAAILTMVGHIGMLITCAVFLIQYKDPVVRILAILAAAVIMHLQPRDK